MANRCENLLVVTGDDVTPFVLMMEAAEAGSICYDKPVIEHACDTEAQFIFDTAWKPCVDWLGEQSRIYPQLSFELSFHEGNCFECGVYRVSNGEITSIKMYDEKTDEALSFIKEVFGWSDYPM